MESNGGQPKISIVTPSFNQGEFIRECIESVLSQGYDDLEHIVIDNCSSDETIGVLKSYPHLRWISEPDQGQSDALNKGFQMATGDLIGWLNADDYYLPGCFEKMVPFARENPQGDVLYGDYRRIDLEGRVLQVRCELDYDLFMLKYVPHLYIVPPAMFFRRLVFADGNRFDVSYRYALDFEFVLRLALKGYTFCHLSAILTDFRVHPGSTSVSYKNEVRQAHDRAVLQHDEFLRRVPPAVQRTTLLALRGAARAKRYTLKALKGYYFRQWSEK
ncbi:MAG: glycosyltransferase [Acidobacteria bacterium]|nr:glycosyltransferase [Acidobacteriota bacterium]